ncbi:hypothetical protein [Streptomyces werraensis]|uniref:hypothetical protein n=1 Tax=Streptomyces werraensis TaxID=68284 RepID=UPI0036AEFD26
MTQETITEPVSVIEPRAAIESADSAPVGPYTHSQRFDYTGSVQDFTVPPGVTRIDARCWGGGGGRSSTGGGGGFATGRITVVPGETLRIVVDLGGGPDGGGGMSGLYSQRLGKTLLIAGGGGGGGTSNAAARGGPGGGTSGLDARTYSSGSWKSATVPLTFTISTPASRPGGGGAATPEPADAASVPAATASAVTTALTFFVMRMNPSLNELVCVTKHDHSMTLGALFSRSRTPGTHG